MKKLIMTALAFGLASALWAASTTSFTYQAALRDEHGNVITNGEAVVRNFHVKLRLWNQPSGGELLWGRTFNVMADEEGLFNLEVSDQGGTLPDETPKHAGLKEAFLNLNPGEIYVGLEVDGSTGEIVPRQRLLAVPYAAVADDVRGISGDIVAKGNISVGSGKVQVTPDGFIQSEGSSIFTDVAANGDVTVAGAITAKGGLTVEGGKVVVKTDVDIAKEVTVKGPLSARQGLSVEGGKLEVNADFVLSATNKLMVGEVDVMPVPVGGIIMWTKTTLPDDVHWAWCNGQNGTPDLRDRFIVGAGKNYAYGATGGTNEVALTAAQMPKHTHTTVFYGYGIAADWKNDNEVHTVGDISEEERYKNSKTSDDGPGENQPHENRPPYYALNYIMRIK